MINKKWDIILEEEFRKPYFKELGIRLKNDYKTKIIFPEYNNIFNALRYTDYDQVKIVILGQDPYHGENQAHGLAFSVMDNVKRPPSLNNIFKELENDLNIRREKNSLDDWAKQGIFLLNAIMTVEKDQPLSHKGIGWEIFTDNIIRKLNERNEPIVFVLWGSFARSKKELITNPQHLIIENVHPSPLSAHRGFFGSKPFSEINSFLEKNNIEKINW
ncbi:MAG: uracil-DNA glycosylase [Bacilli bacterium]|nr:uracil-DNA glycosylase [Bacilli bacterium]MDD4607582.1 uracil-DNA glycosylase [Bacilli bacterium]